MVLRSEPDEIDAQFRAFCERGDHVAFEVVYRATRPTLMKAARRALRTRDQNAAEDLVHATFVTAIEDRSSFEATRRVTPWLLGILRNRSLHWHRRRRLEPQLDLPDVADRRAVGSGLPCEALSIESEIARLPEPYREVVRRRFLEAEDPQAIACALGRQNSTVRSQLTRGVRMLRRGIAVGLAGLARALGSRSFVVVAASLVVCASVVWTSAWWGGSDGASPTESRQDLVRVAASRGGVAVAEHRAQASALIAEDMPSRTRIEVEGAPRASVVTLVNSATGRAIVGAWVVVEQRDRTSIVRSSDEGEVNLPGAEPSTLRWPAARAQIEVGVGRSEELSVAPGFVLRGVVRDELARPCPGAIVWRRDGLDLPIAECGSDGHFEVEVLSSACLHELVASCDGRSSASCVITGSVGETIEREFVLDRAAGSEVEQRAEFRFFGATENAPRDGAAIVSIEPPPRAASIEGWTAWLLPEFGSEPIATSRVSRGAVQFDELPDRARLALAHPSGAARVRGQGPRVLARTAIAGPFAIPDAASPQIVAIADSAWPSAWLEFLVNAADPAEVLVLDPWGRPSAALRLGSSAVDSIGPLLAGPARVAARIGAGPWQYLRPFELEEYDRRRVTLTPTDACSVRVRLRGPSGAEPNGAKYSICAFGAPVLLAPTDDRGGAHAELACGTYEVFATAPGFACVRRVIVATGSAQDFAIDVAPASPMQLELVYVEGQSALHGRATIAMRVEDERGVVVWREHVSQAIGAESELSLARALPDSARRIVVDDSRGWCGIGELLVGAPRVALRKR